MAAVSAPFCAFPRASNRGLIAMNSLNLKPRESTIESVPPLPSYEFTLFDDTLITEETEADDIKFEAIPSSYYIEQAMKTIRENPTPEMPWNMKDEDRWPSWMPRELVVHFRCRLINVRR
jgi:hypothetical protein